MKSKIKRYDTKAMLVVGNLIEGYGIVFSTAADLSTGGAAGPNTAPYKGHYCTAQSR